MGLGEQFDQANGLSGGHRLGVRERILVKPEVVSKNLAAKIVEQGNFVENLKNEQLVEFFTFSHNFAENFNIYVNFHNI